MGGFKEFLFRGNLVQLAVAVVIGAAFGNLVTAFTSGLITPLLGIFGQTPSFKTLYFSINGSVFLYGNFIDACLVFLITALIIYYAVVVPSTWVMDKYKKVEEADQTNCSYCCSKISKKATKCAHCTATVEPVPEIEVLTQSAEHLNGDAKAKNIDKNHVAPEDIQ
ncbi:large-conductance mechanosensitive channel-like [Bradysia coprophila]|uniref:large-conductance mechanosensitive channel-like n=1 Tax=Bradysia coprophila TaxID=38358 RepID=UPI00187DD178|nr:large-conductance mechanosensitive channel-like [Bradysia coprophila]